MRSEISNRDEQIFDSNTEKQLYRTSHESTSLKSYQFGNEIVLKNIERFLFKTFNQSQFFEF